MNKLLAIITLIATSTFASAQLIQFELRTSSDTLGMDGPTTGGSTSSATGGIVSGGSIVLDTSNNQLTLSGVAFGSAYGFTDLQNNFTQAHIHDSTGGTTFPLTINPSGDQRSGIMPVSQVINLTQEQADHLVGGLDYINIHSVDFPTEGEIRGNLTVVPEPHEYALAAGLGLLAFALYRKVKLA